MKLSFISNGFVVIFFMSFSRAKDAHLLQDASLPDIMPDIMTQLRIAKAQNGTYCQVLVASGIGCHEAALYPARRLDRKHGKRRAHRDPFEPALRLRHIYVVPLGK